MARTYTINDDEMSHIVWLAGNVVRAAWNGHDIDAAQDKLDDYLEARRFEEDEE